MFVQIMDMRTDNIDAVRRVDDEWERATEGKNTVRRRILCQDRDDPSRYLNIVFFDSYESAMQNSALPETDRLSTTLDAALDGPPIFVNLDVLEDES